MNASPIRISIPFRDAILPVLPCDDGLQRVPLKPIVEVIGLDWRTQRRKVDEGTYLHRRLGVKVEGLKPLSHPQICLRMDRVEAFLNTLNPENIRSMGNSEAADWLEELHTIWDAAIHAVGLNVNAAKKARDPTMDSAIELLKAKRTADPKDVRWIEYALHQTLVEIGIPEGLLAEPQYPLSLPARAG